MSETLLNINVTVDQNLQDWLPESALEELVLETTNEVADLAQGAYQAKVPIRTGQLRNTQIQKWLGRLREDGMNAEIFVPHELHTNSWQADKPFADVLADLLDTNNFKRSQTSISSFPAFPPVAGGESTEGWQEEAYNDLTEALNGI